MALDPQRVAFIEKYKDAVIDSTTNSGIFASVKMAQMIIESSDSYGNEGQGLPVIKANNYFGIKADPSWKGDKVLLSTPKDGQALNYFRVYKSVNDSISDHTKFLGSNPRYTTAGVFAAKDPFSQLLAIERAGYAEGAGYAAKLTKIIVDYKLESLDREQESRSKKKYS